MRKISVFFIIIISLFFCFVSGESVSAFDYIINEEPTSTEITYGMPLFESKLVGGVSEVEGTFFWVDDSVVLDAGESLQKVLFVPDNNNLEAKEIDVVVKVNRRKVILVFEKEIAKLYDSLDSIKLPQYTVSGIIDNDVYVRGNLIGTLENRFIGENINVNLSGIELAGDKKDNYYLHLSGFSANVYPKKIEMFEDRGNVLEILGDNYIPIQSSFYVKKSNVVLEKEGYEVKGVYDTYVLNKKQRVDVSGKVSVKIKIDESELSFKRISLYNYYNGEYEEIDYTYSDGVIVYECEGLGMLVITSKQISYTWVYVVLLVIFSIVLSVFSFIVIRKIVLNKKKKKIKKYKSLKRRKDYGD